MPFRPEPVEDWFQKLPDLLSSKSWTLACGRPQAALLHKEGPSGGRVLKIDLSLDLPGPVLLRPEARPMYDQLNPQPGVHTELQKLIAPGEAIIRTHLDRTPSRLANALFGKVEDSVSLTCTKGTPMHYKTSRDFPQQGDSGYTCAEAAGKYIERLVWLRPDPNGKCRIIMAWQVPHEEFALWATFQFVQLMESVKASYEWFYKHLSTSEAMKLEQEFYVSLSVSRLGGLPPLVPGQSDSCIYVDAGQSLGLCHWEHFEGTFHLAEYLKIFLARMGEEICAFQSKDGRKLAPHQCVVRRDQWQQVRGRFFEAFRIQKSAYRRCNGGKNAPVIYENARLELLDVPRPQRHVRADPQGSVLVIHNTFWDVQERPSRSMKRRRTVSFPLSRPIFE